MEMKKVVLKLELQDDSARQKVMKTVSGISGIDSISINMKDKKMTVIGDVDPVRIVNKLKKRCYTEIISVGPAKEAEKKKEEPEKEEHKKADDNKNDIYFPGYYYVRTADYGNYPNRYYYASNPLYSVKSAEEYPNICVIC